jgi:lipoate-protein ligase A
VSASYRVLCGGLVEAYREIGVPADLTPRPRGDRGAGACYLHATAADLSLGAAKLSGSAQVWSGASCLQHGSFVISRDAAREARVFRLGEGGAAALDRQTDTITGALGARPEGLALTDALLRGLARGLDVTLGPDTLSASESEDARRCADTFRIRGVSR